ncbi:hypothetical protein ABZ671_31655 [Micromonospora sp. NPDC006766]|uniref:hypothetical protein n=1 Tax=Micromonospora sp. NPDC006766 TaxID=3154778 RepID=UPI0033FC078B
MSAVLTEVELDQAGDRVDVMARLARRVPLAVLAARLGLADPAVVGPVVAAVAAAYHGGADPAVVARADEAVAALLLRFDAANRDPVVFAEPDRFLPGRPGGSLTLGGGPRGCPGERHARALAAGVVDVLRRRCHPTAAVIRYAPHPTLRVPTSIEVTVR